MKKIDDKSRTKIISALNKGQKTESIAKKMGYSRQQVAAVKAHMTMNTY